MRNWITTSLVLLGILLPGLTFAGQGILLLADDGTPEWNAHVMRLVTAVDAQRPTELTFWPATAANLQAAVDRLVGRGVSEVVAVPLFIAAPPSDLGSTVKSSVPLRVTAPLNGDPIVADIVLSRAQEISRDSAAEALVLVSHRSTAGSDKRWVPDLKVAIGQLNLRRSFAAFVTATVPSDAPEASAADDAILRRLVEREIARGRRILVVPVLTSYGGTEPAIEDRLQGLAHEVAKSALMPDDRLVAWIVSRAETK